MPLYFIQVSGGGPIKIGFSRECNIHSRLRTYEWAAPWDCELLGVWMKGDRAKEKALYSRLANHQIKGEWFHSTDEVMAIIADVLQEKVDWEQIKLTAVNKKFNGSKRGEWQRRTFLTQRGSGQNPVLAVRMPADVFKELQALAIAERCTLPEYVRGLVREHLRRETHSEAPQDQHEANGPK